MPLSSAALVMEWAPPTSSSMLRAWRSQLRSVSAVQPILAAIEVIAAHSDG